MTITLNGESRSFDAPMTVSTLLDTLGVSPLTVVVEHNGAILERERFGDHTVHDGDTLELIRFVGGG